MQVLQSVNEFVVRFANVNGSGSASANLLFAKSVFRMGVPIAPRNIFPSNIQGLPTWFEVRVSGKGHLGRRGGWDLMVAMNPQTWAQDVAGITPGGVLLYDSTLKRNSSRDDIQVVGIPLTRLCIETFGNHPQRQLFKNMVYVGALAALLDIGLDVIETLVAEQFAGKSKLIKPNMDAVDIGYGYAREHFDCPLPIRVERSDAVGDKIMISGNEAVGLGCVYGGATVAAWYPITPSTSVADAFDDHCAKLRIDPETGRHRYAIVQAEDELSAIGVALGAGWNGARAFTATSGPGISLMSEFIGLGYFAEIPVVLFDIQRGGPSTGMPTRTQQSDVMMCAYASHGDTKHVLLFPSNPKECFDFAAEALDLAERLQTPIFVMSDLDLGMNDWVCDPLEWDDSRTYDRGKVLSAEDLDAVSQFGRYLDVGGDGIPYRTLPGAHPSKGSFFTRGTSRDRFAKYTEDGSHYVDNMERLLKKFKTAESLVPQPEITLAGKPGAYGVIFYGTTHPSMLEAAEMLAEDGIALDLLRVRGFPFNDDVRAFLERHDQVFVIEQNRDGQMRTLLINEAGGQPNRLISLTNYDGMPIGATFIADALRGYVAGRQPVATEAAE